MPGNMNDMELSLESVRSEIRQRLGADVDGAPGSGTLRLAALYQSLVSQKDTDVELGPLSGQGDRRSERIRSSLEDARYSPASEELPNQQPGNRTLDGAELKALRRAASRLERPEEDITFRVTQDGRAIATGPKGTCVLMSRASSTRATMNRRTTTN